MKFSKKTMQMLKKYSLILDICVKIAKMLESAVKAVFFIMSIAAFMLNPNSALENHSKILNAKITQSKILK